MVKEQQQTKNLLNRICNYTIGNTIFLKMLFVHKSVIGGKYIDR